MAPPPTTLLAGPPGPGLDLLRGVLRRNRAALSRLGVAVARARPAAIAALPAGAARRVLILDAAEAPRAGPLRALRDAVGAPPRVLAYVDPPGAALAARIERGLLAGKPLARQLARIRPIGYRAALEPLEAAFGAAHLSIRISGPAHLPGAAILDDFRRAAGLPETLGLSGAPSGGAPLSLEGALLLDRLLARRPGLLGPARDPGLAEAALRAVRRIAGRPYAPPRDHLEAVIAASRDDIAWLEARAAAPLAEPRRRCAEPAWAMDADALDSLADLVLRLARQSAELRALRRRARETAAG